MILALIVTTMLFGIFFIVGHATLVLIGAEPENRDLLHGYAMTLGTATYSLMLFLLCLLKLCNLPATIVGSALLLAASALFLHGRLGGLIRGVIGAIDKKTLLLIALFFALTLPGLLLALAPPYYKDSLIYHLYIPREMIAANGFVTIPGLSNTNFPLGLELIFGVGVMTARPEISCLLHYGFFYLLLFAVYRITRRYSQTGAIAATVAVALTPSMQITASWAYIDVALAFFSLAALVAICDGALNSKRSGLLLIGLLLGWTLWIKYLSLYFTATSVVCLFTALMLKKPRPKIARAIGAVIFAGVVAGALASPWYIKNIIETGNPVYPYFPAMFGGAPLWNALFDKSYFHLLSGYGHGEGVLKFLLSPWYLVRYARFESIEFDGVIGWVYLPLFLLFIMGVLYRKNRDTFATVASISVIAGYILWLTNSQQLRFLLPSLAVVPVLAIAGAQRIFSTGFARRIIAVLVIALSLTGLFSIGQYYAKIRPERYALGTENRHIFLMRVDPLTPIYTQMNENLPPDAKIFLLIVGNKRFYLERAAYSDSIFEYFTVEQLMKKSDDPADMAAWFLENGFGFILFDEFYLKKSFNPKQIQFLQQFYAQHTRLVKKDGYYVLVEIMNPKQAPLPVE